MPALSSVRSFSLNVYARSPLELNATALFVSFLWYLRVKGLNLGCILDLSWFLAIRTCSRIVCSNCAPLRVRRISLVVVSSWSNSYGSTSPGVGGTGSAVSSAKICGWSHTSFHWSLATVALTCAGVISSCILLLVKRCANTVGLMVVWLLGLSTSISVGIVSCGGVTSGELMATLFLRGLGEETSMCSTGGSVQDRCSSVVLS